MASSNSEGPGAPLATFLLASSSERSPPSRCRLWLPIDLMFGLRCQAGAIMLVALSGPNSQPVNLQDRFTTKLGFTLDKQDFLGECFVPAELWPSQRLRNGTAAVSEALSAMLGSPSPGETITLHQLPSEINTAQTCSTVVLQLCTDSEKESSAVPVALRKKPTAPDVQPEAGSPSPITPAQRGRGAHQPPRASPPSMRGSANSQPVPNLLGPSKERPASGKKKSGGGSRGGSDTAEKKEFVQKDEAGNAVHLAAVQGLLKGQLDDKLRNVLQVLASQILQQRFVLQGNMVALPILGLDIFLRIQELSSTTGGVLLGPSQITSGTFVQIQDSSETAAQHGSNDPSSGPSYAQQAAQAAGDALGEGEGGPAGLAAMHAAMSGMRSMGSPLSDLGGLNTQMDVLRQSVTAPLRNFELFASHNIFPPSGLLFHGPPGTGKTALARAAATDAKASFFVINGPDIVSEYLGESESCLKGIFSAAKALAPSVIFIDEIDALAPARGGSSGQGNNQSPVSARLVTTLLTELDGIKGHAVVVLAATNRLEALDDSLRRPGRLDKEIEVGVPDPAGRLDILHKMLKKMHHSLEDAQVAALADEAHGFVGADLSALCSEAAMSALRRIVAIGTAADSYSITIQDFNHAKSIVRPSALREVVLETPKVTWDDIGGNDEVKQQLKEVVQWPRLFKDSLARIGAIPPRGVLLYGPPGCSKTLLAKAVAREANMNFLAIKGPELFNKYVGESEKALRQIFQKARTSSPAIIFFDEIDGMIGSRGEDGNAGGVHVGERVLSQLLQEMDGLQNGASELVVMAATNRPDCMDAALLRPGRFDRLLYLAPPDTEARKAIFKIHTRAMPLGPEVNLEELAQATEGYSGADIAAVCQQAALIALESDEFVERIEMQHLEAAVERVVPTTLDEESKEMYNSFRRRVN